MPLHQTVQREGDDVVQVLNQVLEEGSHLSGEYSQVQEASGQLVAVLRQVTIPQGLHGLSVMLLSLHVAETRAVDSSNSLLDPL